jgi:hypothetical protein
MITKAKKSPSMLSNLLNWKLVTIAKDLENYKIEFMCVMLLPKGQSFKLSKIQIYVMLLVSGILVHLNI